MNSSKRVNYSTKAAKNIERKMIRDLMIRFSSIIHLSEYTYIGFGAKYFSDFLLFHKHLHINKLISIEGDVGNKAKYEFNRPLKIIDMKFGKSEDIIPTLKYDRSKALIWLDYDGILEESCLTDAANITSDIEEGSILIFSYNSRPPKDVELNLRYPDLETSREKIEKFITDQMGSSYLPFDIETRGLKKWKEYSILLRKVLTNCINKRLEIRNRGKEKTLKLHQIININYKDGVEMSTLGFIFYENDDFLNKINQSRVSDFDFYVKDENPYEINMPNLTLKEIKSLIEEMPYDSKKSSIKNIVPESDIMSFEKIYKYIPIYSDTELA